MPFGKIDIEKEIEKKCQSSPEFEKGWRGCDQNIYNFDEELEDGRLVEKPEKHTYYDIPAMTEMVEKMGRPFTKEESEKYIE